MTDIFISYKAEQRERVRPIVTALQAAGRAVWWDACLEASVEAYPTQIWNVLSEAKAVLVFWSRDAIASDWVVGEAEAARKLKTLTQIRLDDVGLRPPFNVLECLDFSSWSGDESSQQWQRLGEQLDRAGALAAPQHRDVLPDLPPHLISVLRAARASEQRAAVAQQNAQEFARRADASALRARSGGAGYVIFKSNGGTLEGEGHDGVLHGLGVIRAEDGTVYRGQFRDSRHHGYGVLTVPSANKADNFANRFEGEFSDNSFMVSGAVTTVDGSVCRGDVLKFDPNGWGVKVLPDGVRYEGELSRGRPHGSGVAFAADNSVIASGAWENGAPR